MTKGEVMETKLEVKGMTCGHCVAAVEQALATVPGVDRVIEVNQDRGEAIVDGAAEPERLIEAVTAEGYEAKVA